MSEGRMSLPCSPPHSSSKPAPPPSLTLHSTVWSMAQLSNCSVSMTLPGAPGCPLYALTPPGGPVPGAALTIAEPSVASLVVNPLAAMRNLILPAKVSPKP